MRDQRVAAERGSDAALPCTLSLRVALARPDRRHFLQLQGHFVVLVPQRPVLLRERGDLGLDDILTAAITLLLSLIFFLRSWICIFCAYSLPSALA